MLRVSHISRSGPPGGSAAARTHRVSINYEPDVAIRKDADSTLLFSFRDGNRDFPIAGQVVFVRMLDMGGRVVHEGFAEADAERPEIGAFAVRRSDISACAPGHFRLEFFHDDPVGTRTAIQTPDGRFGIPCRVL